MARIGIIGAGFSGLSAAAYLSAAGHEVHVFEKNESAGGRARQLKTYNGYTFDMGPSWYWMPDVFERFFADFGHKPSDFYSLKKLDPGFEIYFSGNDALKIPADFEAICELFESIEEGAAEKLRSFISEAEFKYRTGMENLVYKASLSLMEFAEPALLGALFRLDVFSSLSTHVRKHFKDPRLRALMEFPVLFLGASPEKTPALYSLMNYAALKLGTWYPQGGFASVTDAMVKIAKQNGCEFHFNSPVNAVMSEGKHCRGLMLETAFFDCDAVIASCDYQHAESSLLPPEKRNYSDKYWKKKTLAPSSLIFYLGVKRELPKLSHHTLFFDEDLAAHSDDIYKKPNWPARPLFYVCCPSKSDKTVAREGHENLFVLMPLASGLEDTGEMREKYFNILMARLEKYVGVDIRMALDYKQSYCINDFQRDYNSFKGNAYGLANTLSQTAVLKPSIRNKKIHNLFYAGQLSVPGPGVPPALISGKIAAEQVIKHLKSSVHETII